MHSFSATDVGLRRKINQDSIFASETAVGHLPNLFLVADGMGGHNAGDFASKFAIRTIKDAIEKSREKNPVRLITKAVDKANQGLLTEAKEHEELFGMGTTAVIATIIDGYAYVANIGDSRLYLLDETGLSQITKDHSLVEEMVRIGELSEEEARNHPDKHIITRALGASETVSPDFFDFRVPADALILMCSDGLTNMVDEARIEEILTEDVPLKDKCEQLIEAANENGGKDNIAIILIEPDNQEVEESC